MKSVPVLLITHDDLLWQRWRELDPERWLVARGRGLADLRWRDQGRSLAVLDADLPRLPSWQDAAWRRPWPASACWSPAPAPRRTGHPGGRGRPRLLPQLRPPQALAQALEVISTGGIWMGRSLVSRLLRLVAEKGQDAGDWDGGLLTERETTAAPRPAAGPCPDRRGAGHHRTHRQGPSVGGFEKLGVSDRLQLALLVHGISSPSESRSKILLNCPQGQYPGLRGSSSIWPSWINPQRNPSWPTPLPPSSPNSPAAPGFAIATAR